MKCIHIISVDITHQCLAILFLCRSCVNIFGHRLHGQIYTEWICTQAVFHVAACIMLGETE